MSIPSLAAKPHRFGPAALAPYPFCEPNELTIALTFENLFFQGTSCHVVAGDPDEDMKADNSTRQLAAYFPVYLIGSRGPMCVWSLCVWSWSYQVYREVCGHYVCGPHTMCVVLKHILVIHCSLSLSKP